jgi:hypothetical protein
MIGIDRGAKEDRNDRAAFLAGGLQVTLKAPYPRTELIVVTGLATANDAVHVLGLVVKPKPGSAPSFFD